MDYYICKFMFRGIFNDMEKINKMLSNKIFKIYIYNIDKYFKKLKCL